MNVFKTRIEIIDSFLDIIMNKNKYFSTFINHFMMKKIYDGSVVKWLVYVCRVAGSDLQERSK